MIPSAAAAVITVRQAPRVVVASNFRSLRNTGLSHPHQQRKGSCCVDDTDTVAAGPYTLVVERAAKAVCTVSELSDCERGEVYVIVRVMWSLSQLLAPFAFVDSGVRFIISLAP